MGREDRRRGCSDESDGCGAGAPTVRGRWDVGDYAAVFRAMLANQGKYTHVLLSSDDSAVYKQMATALEHREVKTHTHTHT
jgi:hypothetical protein